MRRGTAAAVAATTVLGATVAAVAAGRYAADAALRPSADRRAPAGFDGPELTVHSIASGRIALTRTLASRLPGVYGLTGRGCHAVVGEVLDGEHHAATAATADTVVRRLVRITHGELAPGTRVRLTPQVYIGNPRDALDLSCAEVEVPSELGPLPAWLVPGSRDTWVITVHGLGTTREQPLVILPFLYRHQLPTLDIAYRGDAGAPRAPDGVGHLGDSEWRDLDAAMRYAIGSGAQRIVLHGWSTGASMALHAAARSARRGHIAGLVLDSPVLDWRATLRSLAARRVPGALVPLAVRAAQGRAGLHAERLAEVADPTRLRAPALLLHGPDDTIAPWEASRAFAGERPELITLHTVHRAPHAAMWNADPNGYEEALRRFLTPLM
ncbi:alpha/beta hydrolase [Streptomyces gobiensis]|uniref:alpha/beta hydrolase n=1 Tax=Streptomyces gobiensis TaxID=2875706 RepID=UPI001E4F6B4E|nr:prolyl oligopeptidase family serine peptidase [Streptomyces gobiensis]UGY90670.1 prolyl oligopeptidase family serine peptidase [Streptomyces gobiensis]